LLAEKTGWTMEHILWETPIAVLNQAVHCYLYDAGVKLKRTVRASDDEFIEIAKRLNI